MDFEEFWNNETGPSHFAGLPTPKALARAAWNRAREVTREECAKKCEEHPLFDGLDKWECCARAIRERSNVEVSGGAEAPAKTDAGSPSAGPKG